METVKDNPGVQDAECRVSGLRPEDNVTDLVPVKVSTVEILELGAEQQVIQSGFYDQGYFDQATISYTSITGNPDALNLTVDQIPRGLQLNIIGQNANEEDILNYWIVLFTNQCNAFPVFEVGDMIGWTVISGLDNPLAFFCPPASEAPSSSPAPTISSMPPPTNPPISTQPTPCIPKDAVPFTSTSPVASHTTKPSFYAPHNGKGSAGKGGMSGKGAGKGGSMRLRDLNVWNDDIVATPSPTACIEPEPPSSSKSKKSSSKQKGSVKKSAKKKDPSKSSPSKSKIHESKSSKAKGSPKSKYKRSSSKGSPSKGGKTKSEGKTSKNKSSKSKAKLHAKSSSKILAPTRKPDDVVAPAPSSTSLSPAAPSPTTSNVQLPPSYPSAAPTTGAPPSGIITSTPGQPTLKPTRYPTDEPSPLIV